jgi:hypothetical protein
VLDLNTVDSVSHISPTDIATSEYIDRDVLERVTNHIQSQYIDLDELGVDALKNIDSVYKLVVYEDMLHYINANYLSIYNLEDTEISKNKLDKIGNLVYRFIVIDFYNEILPDFLNKIKVFNIEDFIIYYTASLRNDPSNIKTNLIKVISNKIKDLRRLEALYVSVANDHRYRSILERYGYYIELINFGDSSNFVENYLKRLLEKHEDEIIYRLL